MRKLVIAFTFALFGGGSAAQEPVPATTSVFPGPWMVFFDWGKAQPRGDDAALLDQVVSAYRALPDARLLLSGHTDRSGSSAFNRRAGLKRAEAVRAELEKRGIPRNAVSVASFGEEQPLVPTEDGVREVQNRRVVIELEE